MIGPTLILLLGSSYVALVIVVVGLVVFVRGVRRRW